MSRLSKLKATPKLVKIGDIEIELKPLSFGKFTDVLEAYENKDNKKGMNIMIYESLRGSIPLAEATDAELKEEINQFTPDIIFELVKKIQEVNGLDKFQEKK